MLGSTPETSIQNVTFGKKKLGQLNVAFPGRNVKTGEPGFVGHSRVSSHENKFIDYVNHVLFRSHVHGRASSHLWVLGFIRRSSVLEQNLDKRFVLRLDCILKGHIEKYMKRRMAINVRAVDINFVFF